VHPEPVLKLNIKDSLCNFYLNQSGGYFNNFQTDQYDGKVYKHILI